MLAKQTNELVVATFYVRVNLIDERSPLFSIECVVVSERSIANY